MGYQSPCYQLSPSTPIPLAPGDIYFRTRTVSILLKSVVQRIAKREQLLTTAPGYLVIYYTETQSEDYPRIKIYRSSCKRLRDLILSQNSLERIIPTAAANPRSYIISRQPRSSLDQEDQDLSQDQKWSFLYSQVRRIEIAQTSPPNFTIQIHLELPKISERLDSLSPTSRDASSFIRIFCPETNRINIYIYSQPFSYCTYMDRTSMYTYMQRWIYMLVIRKPFY